jgi:hypothetical protein
MGLKADIRFGEQPPDLQLVLIARWGCPHGWPAQEGAFKSKKHFNHSSNTPLEHEAWHSNLRFESVSWFSTLCWGCLYFCEESGCDVARCVDLCRSNNAYTSKFTRIGIEWDNADRGKHDGSVEDAQVCCHVTLFPICDHFNAIPGQNGPLF